MKRFGYRISFFVAFVAIFALASFAQAADLEDVKITEADGKLVVEIGGKPFTEYLFKSGNKPILWPVYGPSGAKMTRGYPMLPAADTEKADHVHHRSLWFTHGDVNGESFWHEKGEGQPQPTIAQQKVVSVKSGKTGEIVTTNDWISQQGEVSCSDKRVIRFGGTADARWIDFDITISAGDKPVKFGDTKEGCMGIRIAGTMRVDAKKGGKIVNSEGQTDSGAWGKQAPWVDYTGPVGDETVGVAIFNHPTSYRYPSYWHVRTYGLFAANPFGLRYFKGSGNDGSMTLEAGKSVTLRYRFYFHKGDTESAGIAAAFKGYCEEVK